MYKYDLKISIFSENNELEKIINTIEQLDKFIYNIKSYSNLDEDALATSDIIIYNLNQNILDYKNIMKKNCKIILCTDKYDSKYKEISSIILKPFDYDYIKYTIKNIIKIVELEEDLNFANICLNTAIDLIPDMFWIKTLDGIHTVLNKEFCNVVKKSKEDITGKDHYYIWDVSKDDPNSGADICRQTEEQVIEEGRVLNFQETVKIDKVIRQLVTYKAPLYDKNGKAIGTVGIGHDITNLKNLGIEMSILLNSMPYPVLLKDNNNKIQNVNPAFENVFSVTKENVIGEYYDDWAQKTFCEDYQINNEGFKEASFTIFNEEKIVELRSADIKDVFDNTTGQICIFRDVTVQRKLENEIIKNSNIDFMTKLYNRRYLYKFISEQDRKCLLTFLLLDLDYFKSINDTYGHNIGDEAIILTANILNNSFKNDLVVRMGGDEFLVVKVGNFDLKDIAIEAQELLDNLKESFHNRKEFNKLSASIGISQGMLLTDDIDMLLNNADTAMYEAKQNGRSCYSIYEADK